MRLSVPFFKIAIGALLPAVVINSIKNYLFNNQPTPPAAPNTLELPSIPTIIALPAPKREDSRYSFVNQEFIDRREKEATEIKLPETTSEALPLVKFEPTATKQIEQSCTISATEIADFLNSEHSNNAPTKKFMELMKYLDELKSDDCIPLGQQAYFLSSFSVRKNCSQDKECKQQALSLIKIKKSLLKN